MVKNNFFYCFALAISFASGAPLCANAASHPGVFYVVDYVANGTHTDYDEARKDADAYAASSGVAGSVLILKASKNETCDAAPLPSLGISATTSITGYGSGISTILKKPGCAGSKATLSHGDSPNGGLSQGVYQGFTVDANHTDAAACEFYGMFLSSFIDIACGNAASGADHELEFGNRDANRVGWMDNIYMFGLKTFDSSPAGSGAELDPVWSFGTLQSVKVVSSGKSAYSSYARAQLFGPDLSTCSSVPVLTPKLDGESRIVGATISNPGRCASTAHLNIIIQDGPPVTYGMKFTNIADSHAWKLNATGATTYGGAWLIGSNNNSIFNEQPGSNQTIGIYDNGNGNRHVNSIIVDPAGYGVEIDSQTGTFANTLFNWHSENYPAVSGFHLGNDQHVYQNWMLQGSTCGSSVDSEFSLIVTQKGLISSSNPLPSGVKPQNIESCGKPTSFHWSPM